MSGYYPTALTLRSISTISMTILIHTLLPVLRRAAFRFLSILFMLAASSALVYAESFLTLDVVTQKGKGTVKIQLLADVAPKHVERIKQLAREGAYDNMAFHRVIAGFMAQTGDVTYGKREQYNDNKVGTGSSSYPDLYAELSTIPFKTGIVGMARGRYINSANSQFFIMTADHPSLNGQYTVVGKVIEGLNIVRQLKTGQQHQQQGKVKKPDYIRKATITEQ